MDLQPRISINRMVAAAKAAGHEDPDAVRLWIAKQFATALKPAQIAAALKRLSTARQLDRLPRLPIHTGKGARRGHAE